MAQESLDDPVADEGRACHFDSNRHNNTNTKANSHVHAQGNPITIAIANRYGYTESKSTSPRLAPFSTNGGVVQRSFAVLGGLLFARATL